MQEEELEDIVFTEEEAMIMVQFFLWAALHHRKAAARYAGCSDKVLLPLIAKVDNGMEELR